VSLVVAVSQAVADILGVSVPTAALIALVVTVGAVGVVITGLAAGMEAWSAYRLRMARRKGGCAVRIHR